MYKRDKMSQASLFASLFVAEMETGFRCPLDISLLQKEVYNFNSV
jgi:hypothetical protein